MKKYHFKICSDLSKVMANEWDTVVRSANGSVFHTYNWLKAYTKAAPHQSKPYHLLAYDCEKLIGILPAYLTQKCPRLLAHRKYLVNSEPDLREPIYLSNGHRADIEQIKRGYHQI